MKPRLLDHFVMPVVNLATARARYASLGFTVAHDARHPFGTENCCMFFEDGTFIEPLAIGDPDQYSKAVKSNNAFVKGHQIYCENNGPNGFSHLVVKSADSRADHTSFAERDISGGEIVDFGRIFTKPDGTTGEVAFSLAFAREEHSPDVCFFSCQVVKSVPGGRGALVRHANGVLGTKAVIVTAGSPSAFATFFEDFFNVEIFTQPYGISFNTPNGSLQVYSPKIAASEFGLRENLTKGLCLQALVLQVSSLVATRELLAKNGISVQEKQNRIVVAPRLPGQGATLVFEE